MCADSGGLEVRGSGAGPTLSVDIHHGLCRGYLWYCSPGNAAHTRTPHTNTSTRLLQIYIFIIVTSKNILGVVPPRMFLQFCKLKKRFLEVFLAFLRKLLKAIKSGQKAQSQEVFLFPSVAAKEPKILINTLQSQKHFSAFQIVPLSEKKRQT